MPKTRVIFYQESEGEVPVFEWLLSLKRNDPKGWANCVAKIMLLSEWGHELRRPAADTLRDGILELRAKYKVQYRILYFFNGKDIAILAHAIIKSGSAVDLKVINKALERKLKFKANPMLHTFEGEE